ncbi:hypothetical protein MMC25_008297 [Agyrium rufum]|nr:hypothetical protein [Agyrium rufum]
MEDPSAQSFSQSHPDHDAASISPRSHINAQRQYQHQHILPPRRELFRQDSIESPSVESPSEAAAIYTIQSVSRVKLGSPMQIEIHPTNSQQAPSFQQNLSGTTAPNTGKRKISVVTTGLGINSTTTSNPSSANPTTRARSQTTSSTSSPIKRKPVALPRVLTPTPIQSPSQDTPPKVFPILSTGGKLVAVNHEESDAESLQPVPALQARLPSPPSPQQRRQQYQQQIQQQQQQQRPQWLPTPNGSPKATLRNLDLLPPQGHSTLIPMSPRHSAFPELNPDQARRALLGIDHNSHSPSQNRPPYLRSVSDTYHNSSSNNKSNNAHAAQKTQQHSLSPPAANEDWHANMLSRFRNPSAPEITNSIQRNDSVSQKAATGNNTTTTDVAHQQPTKQGGMLGSFFGWRNQQNQQNAQQLQLQLQLQQQNMQHAQALTPENNSPTTITDSVDHSPLSPFPQHGQQKHPHHNRGNSSPTRRPTLRAIDVPKANYGLTANELPHPLPPPTPAMSLRMEEMEEEIREISVELAGSIRREMELEDQIERLQMEIPIRHSDDLLADRRTSDYFSDSGTSSVKYPLSDIDGGFMGVRIDDVKKLKRRSELEKAQLRLDLAEKVQYERGKRKALEEVVKSLEDKLRAVEENQERDLMMGSKVQELERALDDSRRRLMEEKTLKENIEEMMRGLHDEIEQNRQERDVLRDDVVPQLKTKVQGLEADAEKTRSLTQENAKLQQELQILRSEASRTIFALPYEAQKSPRFNSIMEEENILSPTSTAPLNKGSPVIGLTRSPSMARGTATASSLARSGSLSGRTGSLSRSGSVSKDARSGASNPESRESLADRVKDIELQRDSLHAALKSLLTRHHHQTKEHARRLRTLEIERDKAQDCHSPRRKGYEAEVRGLRSEVDRLRKRADEALEQKWMTEKGLGGLKMDLDRADQETRALRALLREEVAGEGALSETLPSSFAKPSSLEKAYSDLQTTQAATLSHLRGLAEKSGTEMGEGNLPSPSDDAKTTESLSALLSALARAKEQHQKHNPDNGVDGSDPSPLSAQLAASAASVQALATQVQAQLTANQDLRRRLSAAVQNGEKEQTESADRIEGLQGKLKGLEERLMAAQSHSEEGVAVHEEEVGRLRGGEDGGRLRRLSTGFSNANGTPTTYGAAATGEGKKGSGLGGLRLLTIPGADERQGSFSPRSPRSQAAFLGGSSGGIVRSPLRSPMRSPRSFLTGGNIFGGGGAGSGVAALAANEELSMAEKLRMEFLETRVKDLERALTDADLEVRDLVGRMMKVQIEGQELQNARDEAVKQNRTLHSQIAAESARVGSLMELSGADWSTYRS